MSRTNLKLAPLLGFVKMKLIWSTVLPLLVYGRPCEITLKIIEITSRITLYSSRCCMRVATSEFPQEFLENLILEKSGDKI